MKFWMVYNTKNEGVLKRFDHREEAEVEAKRMQQRDNEATIYVLEAVSKVQRPVPHFEMEEL